VFPHLAGLAMGGSAARQPGAGLPRRGRAVQQARQSDQPGFPAQVPDRGPRPRGCRSGTARSRSSPQRAWDSGQLIGRQQAVTPHFQTTDQLIGAGNDSSEAARSCRCAIPTISNLLIPALVRPTAAVGRGFYRPHGTASCLQQAVPLILAFCLVSGGESAAGH
jgi:hypothetical protein